MTGCIADSGSNVASDEVQGGPGPGAGLDLPLCSTSSTPFSGREIAVLALLIFSYFFLEARAAALSCLWFDEICTLVVSSVPTVGGMLRAIPIDGNPPLYFFLSRICLHLPIRMELALRLPSLIAFSLSVFLIYLFVRRNADSVYAYLSVGVFLGSSFGRFASIEARPYALLLCFTMTAVCSWQCVMRGTRRRWGIFGVAASIAGAIFSHHYGLIYVGLPLLIGEGVRSWRGRRLDIPLIAASLLAAATVLITFPPMLKAQSGLLQAVKSCPDFWARPTLSSLSIYQETIPTIFPWHIGLIAASLAFISFLRYAVAKNRPRRGDGRKAIDPLVEDMAVAWSLTLLLPIMLILTDLGTRYFWARYAVGSALGVALLSGLVGSRVSKRLPYVKNVAVAITVYGLWVTAMVFWYVSPVREGANVQSDPLMQFVPAGSPLVIADAVVFAPTWWYSGPEGRSRLHYLADLNYAVKQPDFIPEYSLTLQQQFGAPRIDDYHVFLTNRQEFFLYCFRMPRLEWVKSRLIKDGWRLFPVASIGGHDLFRVEPPSATK